MKQLQNNFTTPEQSKRLLKLGLPADSADCKFINAGKKNNGEELGYFRTPEISLYDSNFTDDYNHTHKDFKPFPCWSMGRLIEIDHICRKYAKRTNFRVGGNIDFIEQLVRRFERYSANKRMDFSKLEN